jgi:NAD(P)-dependent dehydrogenase (short-subunit alcohol dehydrogenase family)
MSKEKKILEDKVVVMTGGCGFLGKYFSDLLQEAGAKVIVTDVTKEADIIMDVTDQKAIDEVLKKISQEQGKIDVVINNAAIDPKFDIGAAQNKHEFVNYPEEAMQQSVNVNLLGTWRVCKGAIRVMCEQGFGNIVNVASFYGVTPPRQEIYPTGTEKPVDYALTKAGVIMLSRHIASQFGRSGIRCNVLAPGGVIKDQPKDWQERYSQHTSLGRMSTPEEVSDALLFLVSDQSRGMTGECLVVDAGWRSR